MRKSLKSIMSIILALIMCFGVCSVALASGDGTTTAPLRFNDDGKFRIMHVTDTHLGGDNVDCTMWLLADACDREKPDLIALTGDIAMSGEKEEILENIDKIMTVFNERNIPVAVTFGNHDSERGIFSREELMAIYNTYPCSISIDDGPDISGCGTYNIPILSSKDETMKFNIWVFDSGDYDDEHHYANVLEDQVEWYKAKSEAIEKENGGKVNSLAFQHIVVPEVYEALTKQKVYFPGCVKHMYNKKDFYTFNKNMENHGQLRETPCCGYYNHGQFDAFVERGDVLGMFTGHDHTNCFDIKYKGIYISNTVSGRYEPTQATFSSQYGYRIIDIDESDTSVYETRVAHWYDYFTTQDLKELKNSGDSYGVKLGRKILVNGFFKNVFQRIGFFFVYVFTGVKVEYK